LVKRKEKACGNHARAFPAVAAKEIRYARLATAASVRGSINKSALITIHGRAFRLLFSRRIAARPVNPDALTLHPTQL